MRENKDQDIRRLRILVAEDSLPNQKLAVAMISKLGHDAVLANNGREAVVLATTQTFDLIFMDIQMPEMDGFEAVRTIREKEVTGRVPIVALTANAMQGDRDRCLSAGMDGYLSKPIRLMNLEQSIQQVAKATARCSEVAAPATIKSNIATLPSPDSGTDL